MLNLVNLANFLRRLFFREQTARGGCSIRFVLCETRNYTRHRGVLPLWWTELGHFWCNMRLTTKSDNHWAQGDPKPFCAFSFFLLERLAQIGWGMFTSVDIRHGRKTQVWPITLKVTLAQSIIGVEHIGTAYNDVYGHRAVVQGDPLQAYLRRRLGLMRLLGVTLY